MIHLSLTARRLVFVAASALLCLSVSSRVARAQADNIYTLDEVTKPPRLASVAATARLLERSYPNNLKTAGIGGNVQLRLVVNANGKVEESKTEIVSASVPALGDAAKSIASRLDFVPAEVNGKAVRTEVVLPLLFKP